MKLPEEIRRGALIHKSLGNLEFFRLAALGDSVFNLWIVSRLFSMGLDEEDISTLASDYKSNRALYLTVKALGMEDYLIADEGAKSEYSYASMFEAIVGLLYIHFPIEAVFEALDKDVWPILGSLHAEFKNYWQVLWKEMKGDIEVMYTYSEGCFTAHIYRGNELLGKGTGRSKREARNEAAKMALASL